MTLPARLLEQASQRPKGVAMRVKELGRWREITWAQHLERVSMIGDAMLALGIKAGDRIAIMSDNRPEWVAIDLAAQGIGATTVGLLTSLPENELEPLLQRCEARVVFVEDEEQHDKLMAVRASTKVERVVVIDTRGFRQIAEPAMSLDALEAVGHPDAHTGGAAPGWSQQVAGLDPDSAATIVFTAGTTGAPKGVMFSHAALVAAGSAATQAFDFRPSDDQYSYLPLAEISERLLTVAVGTTAATTVHFGEGGESFLNDLREVQPTVLFGPPRLWERMCATVDGSVRRAGWLKRSTCGLARRVGARAATRARRGERARGPLGLVTSVFVSRPLRTRLGLGRIRVALSGTAPAQPQVLDDLWTLGIPVRETYGVAETAGIGAVQPVVDMQEGSVGRAIEGNDVRIGEGGVVELRSTSMFRGYLDAVDPSAKPASSEGWFRTGDLGELSEHGDLRILGRADDALLTSSGTKVVPEPIEQLIAASPYIRDVVLVGAGRPQITALVGIDADAVRDWAAQRELTFNTYADLVQKVDVRELVQHEIDVANAQLAEHERVQRFELLPVELSHDEGLLTATSKVRRGAVLERFDDLVARLYDEGGPR